MVGRPPRLTRPDIGSCILRGADRSAVPPQLGEFHEQPNKVGSEAS
jgi:hypothetical protein